MLAVLGLGIVDIDFEVAYYLLYENFPDSIFFANWNRDRDSTGFTEIESGIKNIISHISDPSI
jgi:hypothetical protein